MCCLSARHPCTAQVEYGSAVYLKWGEGHLSATAFNNNTAGLDPAPVFAQDATRLALYGTTDAGVVSGSLGFEAAVVSRVSTFRPHTESTACGAMPPPPPPVVELLLVPPPMSPLSPVGAPPFFQTLSHLLSAEREKFHVDGQVDALIGMRCTCVIHSHDTRDARA